MKITEYVKYDQHRTFLYEGLDSHAINEAREWERILRPIVEAQLTPDQINTLFQQAQQVATDAGGNRTGIGKGVDYVAAKAEAWEKIKTALQNTGPIQGFEAQYDKLAAKIKEKTGGDQGIMKYIQMYRDLATQYPKTQKVVYGVAIAGVGILALGGSVAAMSGGPVILGLLKMTDRLLQGDKLTSAIWQGVKTGALAAVGVGVGKGIRNMLGFGAPTGVPGPGKQAAGFGASKIVNRPDDFGPTGAQPQGGGKLSTGETPAQQSARYAKNDVGNTPGQQATKDALRAGNAQTQATPTAEPELKGKALADKLAADNQALSDKWAAADNAGNGGDILNGPPEIQGNKQLSAAYKSLVSKIQSTPDYNVRNLPGDIQRFASQNSVGGLQATKDASTLNLLVQKAGGGNMNGFLNAVKNAAPQVARGATTSAADFESVYETRLREELSINRKLPKSQITEMFRQVDEGVWDTVKKGVGAAAGAVASGAKAVAGSRIGQAVGATAKDAAGAVAQKVGTVATNLTTKVTTDKLMKAWKAAGSPTDSVEVYYLMKNQGLDDATLTNIFKAAKVRTPVKNKAGSKPPAATPPAAGGTPPAATPQAPAAGGKQLSQTPGAIKKRAARAAAKAPPAPVAAPASAPNKGFNVNLRQTPAQKNAMALTKAAGGLAEEGENDTPLDKAAINKIFMSIAQAGAGGSSPQQQAPAAGNTAPQQGSVAQAAPDDEQQPAQGSRAPAQKSNGSSAAPAGSGSAPASGGGYTGPDVPLNKAAINKILMAVAQAGA
jgi:hypothetical protein